MGMLVVSVLSKAMSAIKALKKGGGEEGEKRLKWRRFLSKPRERMGLARRSLMAVKKITPSRSGI